jgi:hypothetical protein
MFYVGLDIHTKRIAICSLNKTGHVVHRAQVRSIEEMMRLLSGLPDHYEASCAMATSTTYFARWPRGSPRPYAPWPTRREGVAARAGRTGRTLQEDQTMTEAQWLACINPTRMLEYLRFRASDRKLRLFAVACCRRSWAKLTNAELRACHETAELFADGKASQKTRGRTFGAAQKTSATFETSPLEGLSC